jgi:F-type H+-transporting ATPase subunit b
MTFSLSTFIFEIINFLVLMYVLQRLLYHPLHAMIDRRREAIARAQEDAAETKRQAEELRRQLEEQKVEVEGQRREILVQAREEAEEQRKKLLDRADVEARLRLDDARRSIELEGEDARKALQGHIARAALQLTERLLRESSDSTLQAQLLQRLLMTLDALSIEEREQLERGSLPDSHALIESAFRLQPPELEAIQAAVSRALGSTVLLDPRTNPDLIAGVRLHVDGHVWDASLAGPLQGVSNEQ